MALPLALTLPLRGSQLIEASAGTGKTYTIALLYTRLILGSLHSTVDSKGFDRPLQPRDILVVTFTDAAAQELRERIRQRLLEAANAFRVKPSNATEARQDPLLQLRDNVDAARWPACADRLADAAANMDEAAISTIHSWCKRMLKAHAFASGSLFDLELITDLAEYENEAIQDYWRTHFNTLTSIEATLVYRLFATPADLLNAVKPLLARPDAQRYYAAEMLEDIPIDEVLAQVAKRYAEAETSEAKVKQLWANDHANLHELWYNLRPKLNGKTYNGKTNDDTFAEWLAEVDAWANNPISATNLPKLVAQPLKLNKGGQIPDHPFFDALSHWLDLENDADAASQRVKAQLLAHAARWVRERLNNGLQAGAAIDFNGLLHQLDHALAGPGGERLGQILRQRFPVALIDEFQDTDPQQYRIFDRIYHLQANDPSTTIVLIGDPKQAIYGFRGADIHAYLQARTATTGRHYTLDTNFRATHALVAAVNQAFMHADTHNRGAFRFKQAEHNPIPFQPVCANGRREILALNGKPAPAMTAWLMPPAADKQVVNLTDYRSTMAAACASQIVTWLWQAQDSQAGFRGNAGLTPLKPADMAILVRDGKEAEAMQMALATRGINSVYLSQRDSVFATEQAQDMLFWLQACATPDNPALLRQALASATLALDWPTLMHFNTDELAWEAQVLRFRNYHASWQRHGVLAMLHQLLHDFGLPQRLLQQSNGERRLTNLLHLAEWAQHKSLHVDGEQALLRAFAEQIEQGNAEQVLRLESDAELVKIVTIHKSKGLQYPLVLLPFISGWKEWDGGKGHALYHNQAGHLCLEFAKKDKIPQAYHDADDERLSEDMRLLYVALTRAEYGLWLGLAPLVSGNSKSPQLHKGALGYLLAGDKHIATHELASTFRHMAGECPHIELAELPAEDSRLAPRQPGMRLGEARTPQHTNFARWHFASYSGLKFTEAATSQPSISKEQPAAASLHAFPRGSRAGQFLHDILEWIGTQGFAAMAAKPEARQAFVTRQCQTAGWGDWAGILDHWLAQLLTTPLAFSASPIQLADLQSYLCEMEFWFASRRVNTQRLDSLVSAHTLAGIPRPTLQNDLVNGLLTGYIDLAFADPAGRYYVLDWKSNYLGPDDTAYSTEALQSAMAEHRYDLQSSLYLLALHRHLRQRLPDYNYDRHIGGAVYCFLRGYLAPTQGLFVERPPKTLIDDLDKLFRAEESPEQTFSQNNALAQTPDSAWLDQVWGSSPEFPERPQQPPLDEIQHL